MAIKGAAVSVEAQGQLELKGAQVSGQRRRRWSPSPAASSTSDRFGSAMTELLGSGLSFPLTVDRRGGIALATGEQDVDQAIEIILSTAPGERPMRPEFGCGVHDFVFDTIDAATVGRLETEVRAALDRWEPRIAVEEVEFDLSRMGDGQLLINIGYRLRATNNKRNLVYPFYVIPEEEEARVSRLPDIQLDDRRFQDLVSEARLRITRSCPEWTEHNVSDPGITLIELFAWMTEMTIYRLNRVPDKLHVTLLELLGIQLDGPSSAATDVRFRLVEPPTEPLLIPGGETEVEHPAHRARRRGRSSRCARTSRSRPPSRPPTCCSAAARSRTSASPTARRARRAPTASRSATRRRWATRCTSASTSRSRRLVLQVDVDASPARGAGVSPEDPPLRWEVSQGDNQWEEAIVLEDLTGGFNYGAGAVELQLPPRSAIQPLGGHRMHWVRCRIDDKTRHGGAATTYTQAPEIYSITAAPVGALLPASHAAQEENEVLGVSDGTPGQTFALRYSPVLKPSQGETLEVQDPESGDWAAWELRPDFVVSTTFDRHYVAQPGGGRDRARPRDPRDRRRLDPVRLGAAQGRGHALHQVPPRRRAQRQRRRRRADRDALRAPGRRHGQQPRPGQRRRRRRDAGPRAPARGDGDPLALPRRHRRGLRVPGRRGVAEGRARGLRPAAGHRRPGRAAPGAAADPGRPPARLRRAGARRGPAAGGLRVPRRAAPDRHDRRAAPVRLPRPVGRREPPGLAARRHRARGGGRRARALHVHQPAGGRQPDGPRRRAGRSAARSTRASCTASSTPSRASSS